MGIGWYIHAFHLYTKKLEKFLCYLNFHFLAPTAGVLPFLFSIVNKWLLVNYICLIANFLCLVSFSQINFFGSVKNHLNIHLAPNLFLEWFQDNKCWCLRWSLEIAIFLGLRFWKYFSNLLLLLWCFCGNPTPNPPGGGTRCFFGFAIGYDRL